MRRTLVLWALAVVLVTVPTAALAAPAASWKVVKRGSPVGAGELAVVGSIVPRPARVAFRATVPVATRVSLTVVVSCRQGLVTRVGRQRLAGVAPFTKPVTLPLPGADHCAVSATGSNPAGTLRLDLLRGA